MDLLELAHHLKQEQLFVVSEKAQLQKLFDDVKKVAEELYQKSWVSREQKTCLDTLIVTPQNVSPRDCCSRTNQLQFTNFVDSYKHLSYHDAKYGEFLKFLRENPRLLAYCVEAGEKTGQEFTLKVVSMLVSAIYGNCIVPEDEHLVLQMMQTFVELQLANCDDPRRRLRKGSCAFSVVYKQFFDSLFSAKLFLTAALHDPVMKLLMEDEWFYDIDAQKALVRFPPAERLRRFGEPGSENHVKKCEEYRSFIVGKLVVLANRFISSLKNNIHCFPASLGWLVAQVYKILTKTGNMSVEKIRAVCADLVFSLFICPAILDPEPYGITSDIQISHIARHNLMQIAQIIQVLAISQWEEDSRAKDLYERFEKGCVSGMLDALVHGMSTDLPTSSPTTGQSPCLSRSSVLLTMSQLSTLVNFLKSVLPNVDESVTECKQLEDLITSLPSPLNLSISSLNTVTTPSQTPPGTPSTQKKHSKGAKKKLTLSPATNPDDLTSPPASDQDSNASSGTEDVLVISLGMDIECPGMMPEQKVLSWEQENKPRKVKYQSSASFDVGVGTTEIHEKRTRFSLSQDQESIGNTSDIQEAISEAASSHSVGSVDLENDDDLADNFSDMISANVSGRGTPNISGRDTPLSQAESQEEAPPQLPETVQKSNRVDVTDRFGKFELENESNFNHRHPYTGDETKSTVSDTWSTDVLASDSEPPETNQYDRLEEIREEMVRQSLLSRNEIVSEVSETASDAWSTDVLGSDTEEKQAEILSEFDQDDIGSVTDLASISGEPSQPDGDGTNEDTPLASGRQSPTEDQRLDALGAVGGAIGGTMGGAVGGVSVTSSSMSPVTLPVQTRQRHAVKRNSSTKSNSTTDSVFEENDEINTLSSAPPIPPRSLDGNRLTIPVKPHRGHSSKSGHSKQGNLHLPVPEGGTARFGAGHSMMGPSELRAFSTSSVPDYLSFKNPVYNGAKPKNSNNLRSSLPAFGSSSQSTSQDTTDSSKTETGSAEKQRQVLTWAQPPVHQTDSGFMSEVSADMDSLSNQAGDLVLSEQQNTNLDTRRLSVALSMFDPVSPETVDSGDLLDSSDNTNTQDLMQALSNPSNGSSQVKKSESLPEPLIRFTNDSGSTDTNLGQNSDLCFPVPRQCSPGRVETPPSQFAGDLLQVNPPGSINGDVVRKSPVNGDLSDDMNENRRGSNTSSRSSGSGNSDGAPFSKPSRSASYDNMSQRSAEEKENGDESPDEKNLEKRKGFFKSFKDKFNKGIKKNKSHRSDHLRDELGDSSVSNGQSQLDGFKSAGGNSVKDESTDDILAKYRKKPQGILTTPGASVEPTAGGNEASTASVAFSVNMVKEKRFSIKEEDPSVDTPHYDPNNLESCFAFVDAKRKLRLVLGSTEFQMGYSPSLELFAGGSLVREGDNNRKDNNELVRLLRGQLAEAINLQNKDLIAQLHEAIRCVRMFDNDGRKKLVRSLQDEYHSRSAYISYLIRCRQGLLSTLSHVQRLRSRVLRYKDVCSRHLTSVFVRIFIEKREASVIKFISDFQKLTVADEKTDLVENFLQYLYNNMNQDAVWQAASENQMEDGRLAIERYLMSRIYTHAMFPNGDGDIMRDQLFHQHSKKLGLIITPTHKDLGIPKMYHFECPWTAAQREIYMINAYKTPKDKLQCIQRCSATIMNLLSMANEKSVPAADDFMPVMIFVVIKANPPCILSTIQYINSFYGNRLAGEEQYWWMQFSAAVEFIKTMEYEYRSS